MVVELPVQLPSILWGNHAAKGRTLSQALAPFCCFQENIADLFPWLRKDFQPLIHGAPLSLLFPAQAGASRFLDGAVLRVTVDAFHNFLGQEKASLINFLVRFHGLIIKFKATLSIEVYSNDTVKRAPRFLLMLNINYPGRACRYSNLCPLFLYGEVSPALERIGITCFGKIHLKPCLNIYEIDDMRAFIHGVFAGRRDLQEFLEKRLLR